MPAPPFRCTVLCVAKIVLMPSGRFGFVPTKMPFAPLLASVLPVSVAVEPTLTMTPWKPLLVLVLPVSVAVDRLRRQTQSTVAGAGVACQLAVEPLRMAIPLAAILAYRIVGDRGGGVRG